MQYGKEKVQKFKTLYRTLEIKQHERNKKLI